MNNSYKNLGILIAAVGFIATSQAETDAIAPATTKSVSTATTKKAPAKDAALSKAHLSTNEPSITIAHAVSSDVPTALMTPPMADIKKAIGSVDVYKIFQQSEQAREDEKRIINECETRKKLIEESFIRLQKIQTELQGMMNTATDDAKERKIEEGRELQRGIEVKKQGLEEYQARAAQEAQMKLLKEVEETTEEVRKERGLVIVFAGGTLAVDPSIDLSIEVATRMNKKHAAKKERQTPSRITT